MISQNKSTVGTLILLVLLQHSTPLFADVTEDNITADVALASDGTLDVSGQTTLSGPVVFNSPITLDDQAFSRWTYSPSGVYWNMLLEDGLFVWGDPSASSLMDIEFNGGDAVFYWYPDKATFRVGEGGGSGMDDTYVGFNSVAIGKNAYASDNDSVAIGYGAHGDSIGIGYLAYSYGGIAIGSYATASGGGVSSIAIGSSWIDGDGGIALGKDGYSWDYGVAIGFQTASSSIASCAIGPSSDVYGNRSTSIGNFAYTSSYSSVTLGSFNALGSGQSYNTWVASDELLVVGNGEDDENHSNALVIQKNADAQFAGNVTVAGVVTVSPVGDILMGIYE